MLNVKLSATLLAMIVGIVTPAPYSHFIKVPIDHKNHSIGKYNMQYIVDDQYYNDNTGIAADLPKPIFFYTGNEGSIWDFYKNSGFMTKTLAKKYGALVVFGEHRFFGESWPFPKDVALQAPYNTFLTVEQTLQDYVHLLTHIQNEYEAKDQATIAFGGSYGGMLAAWMRMKFPTNIQGALAASAPVLLFKGAQGVKNGTFAEIVSNDFNVTGSANDSCYLGMNDAFKTLISNVEPGTTFPQTVSEIFNTCELLLDSQGVSNLTDLLRNGYFYMAMTDYPYEASFLQKMPANPVNESCKAFQNWTQNSSDNDTLKMLAESAKVYFNWVNNPLFCYDTQNTAGTGTLAASGWDVLACNQLAMPTTNGNANTSIFTVENDLFDYDQYTQDCQTKYQLNPDFGWAMRTFGGKHNVSQEYREYSKIIFSNGNLDPWLAGGVSQYVSPKIPTFVIKGGAHHLDLRLPNAADPEEVTWVREQEDKIISEWVREYQPDWHGFTEEYEEEYKRQMFEEIAAAAQNTEEGLEFIQN